jgi:TonB family protein
VLCAVGACTPRPTLTSRALVAPAAAPRLAGPPSLLDLDTPSAVYRTAVALHLQPAWAQFLEDCRLRLPRTHALNRSSLAATVDLAIDSDGAVVAVSLSSSGNSDFDRAVRQILADAGPLPRPPRELWGDDDRVHLRWLFARDRRQAGPATAQVLEVLLPVQEVTRRLLATRDLGRAARRIAREPSTAASASEAIRNTALDDLMVAGLREALDSSEGVVQRAALHAITELNLGAASLLAPITGLVASTHDVELRRAALRAAAATGMRDVAFAVANQLRQDVRGDRTLALALAETLVALDAGEAVRTIATEELASAGRPNVTAVWLLGLVGAPELGQALARWQRERDAALRTAVCAAAVMVHDDRGWKLFTRGLQDRDAAVRAACLASVAKRVRLGTDDASPPLSLRPRVNALLRDRDARVRASAVHAFVAMSELQPRDRGAASVPDLASDPAAEVRAALAEGIGRLAVSHGHDVLWTRLLPLLSDGAPDVRAAAWDSVARLVLGPPGRIDPDPLPVGFDELVRAGASDSAPQVRRAVVGVIGDEAVLHRLATTDEDASVKTRALVRLVGRRGRAASAGMILDRFANASPGSAERVRTALAWLLAR